MICPLCKTEQGTPEILLFLLCVVLVVAVVLGVKLVDARHAARVLHLGPGESAVVEVRP